MAPACLRVARVDDAALLLSIYASTRSDELSAWGWDAAQQHAFLVMQFGAQQRHWRQLHPHAVHSIVQVVGQDAGRLVVDRSGHEWLLVDIALLPGWRGRGLGGTLLQALVAEADTAGVPLTLHVLIGNRAQSLYQRLGFVVVDEQGLHRMMRRQPQTPIADELPIDACAQTPPVAPIPKAWPCTLETSA